MHWDRDNQITPVSSLGPRVSNLSGTVTGYACIVYCSSSRVRNIWLCSLSRVGDERSDVCVRKLIECCDTNLCRRIMGSGGRGKLGGGFVRAVV